MASDDKWRRRVPTIVQRLDFGADDDCKRNLDMDADSDDDEGQRTSASSSTFVHIHNPNPNFASRRLFDAPPSPPYKRVRALRYVPLHFSINRLHDNVRLVISLFNVRSVMCVQIERLSGYAQNDIEQVHHSHAHQRSFSSAATQISVR